MIENVNLAFNKSASGMLLVIHGPEYEQARPGQPGEAFSILGRHYQSMRCYARNVR